MEKQYFAGVVKGAIAGLAFVIIPYMLFSFLMSFFYHEAGTQIWGFNQRYSFTLLIILPFVQAALAGYWTAPFSGVKKKFSGLLFILLFDFALAAFFLHEGTICLIMASPLFALVIAAGIEFGRAMERSRKKTLQISLIPLALMSVAYDVQQPVVPQTSVISDAVTINAKPEDVWRYVIHHEQNNAPPEYWLWRVGLPTPIQSTATGENVGAERQCRFTGNLAFDEKITEAVPGKTLTFVVAQQPAYPEIMGHFALDKGQFQLVANPDGTTTVVATSWYRLFIRPAGYFDWWATDIVRNVHFRVLNHIKCLAEQKSVAA